MHFPSSCLKQYDQMTIQRNTLRTQLEEEIDKRAKLEEASRSRDEEWKSQLNDLVSFFYKVCS